VEILQVDVSAPGQGGQGAGGVQDGQLRPVPGGVGPMTRAMLMKNTTQAAAMQNGVAI